MPITIEITFGVSEVGEDDRERARAAALKVLDAARIEPSVAYTEFKRQWAYLETDEAIDAGLAQDHTHMTGLAALWVRAEEAASVALTEGWARPGEAGCGISA